MKEPEVFNIYIMRLCFLLFISIVPTNGIESLIYTKATVSENRLKGSGIAKHLHSFDDTEITHARLLSACMSLSWCEAVCYPPTGLAVLTDMYISSGATDTMAGNKVVCYTKRPTHILYPTRGASLKATQTESGLPARVIENLEDGVYGFIGSECYYAKEKTNPYILVKLPLSKTITRVSLRAQPSGSIDNKFLKLRLRVGDIQPTGKDFSVLSYFGQYNGGITKYNYDVVIKSAAGVVGKYISIHETANVKHTIQVCAIEIFGY